MYKFKSKLSGLVTICAAGILSTQTAQAIPTSISGTISFSGSATTDAPDFLSATRFTNFEEIFVGSPGTLIGDYVGTSGAPVTVSPFIWNPPDASTPITPLWTFESGGNTYSFDLSILQVDFATSTGLFLSGVGTARITGSGMEKLDTEGNWNFSAQTLGTSFTFSSTTQVPTPTRVPDGGSTVLLLGGVLCGFTLLKRKLAV